MTFSGAYFVLISQYFIVSGLSLCIALWWGSRAISAWREGRSGLSNRLMAGFSLVSFGNAINCAIRLPDHYYRGIGLHDLARAWLRDWHMLTSGAAALVVVGYLICVLGVAFANPGERHLYWLLACGVYFALGVAAWWLVGGFGFTYV